MDDMDEDEPVDDVENAEVLKLLTYFRFYYRWNVLVYFILHSR